MFMMEKALTGGRRYWGWVLLLAIGVALGFFCYLRQLELGLGVTGLSRDVTWGLYIAQFTFFVGVAASAVMVVDPRGLKTALRYLVRPPGAPADVQVPEGQRLADLAASFQQAVVDSILAKVELALRVTGCQTLAIGGGVAANSALRGALEQLGERKRIAVWIPPRHLCTDNAAMGALAWERLERGDNDGLELDVLPGTDRSAARRNDARPSVSP